MGILKCLTEAGAIAALLLVPGYFLLSFYYRDEWDLLSGFRKLTYCWFAGLFFVSVVGTQYFLWPGKADLVNAGIYIVIMSVLAHRAAFKHRLISRVPRWSGLVVGLVLLGAFAVGWQVFNTLPGSIEHGYGDLPSYARVIHNLRSGSRPLVDFHIQDYVGGAYLIPLQHPMHVLIVSVLQGFLGGDFRLFDMFNILTGLMALYLGAHLIGERHRQEGVDSTSRWLAVWAGVLCVIFPSSVHFILGCITLPTCFLVMVAFDLLTSGKSGKRVLLIPVFLLLIASRPEGLLVTLLFCIAAGIVFLGRQWERRLKWPPALFPPAAAVLLVCAGILMASTAGKTATYHYLNYSQKKKVLEEAPDFLIDHIRENFGYKRLSAPVNPNAIREVLVHPVSAIRWALGTLGWNFPVAHLFSLSLLLILGLFLFQRKPVRVAVFLCVATYSALLFVNSWFMARHTLPIDLFLAVIVLREGVPVLVHRYGHVCQKRGLLRAGVCLGVCLMAMVQVSLTCDGRRTSDSIYAPIVSELRQRAFPGSVIASAHPQLFGFALNTKSVGNIQLASTLPQVIAKFAPDFIVLDDVRTDPAFQYNLPKKNPALEEAIRRCGYRVVHESKGQLFRILAKGS